MGTRKKWFNGNKAICYMKTIEDRPKSYEDACEELGEQPTTDWGDATPDEVAYKKLKTIAKALNEGWAADYNDGDQKKWIPYFYTLSSSGFAFGDAAYGCSYPAAGGAARLCFKDEKTARYAGKQFLKLWEEFIL
jgi:hypothetical protein